MMSAGQAEISKLKTNMDETAKVVQELRSELHRKKSSQCVQDSKAEKLSGTQTQQVLNNSRNRNGDFNFNQVVGFPQPDEGGCDSVLTEERDQEVMDMDHLEAELESELQKLHWSAVEAIDNEDTSLNLLEVSFQTISVSFLYFYCLHISNCYLTYISILFLCTL